MFFLEAATMGVLSDVPFVRAAGAEGLELLGVGARDELEGDGGVLETPGAEAEL